MLAAALAAVTLGCTGIPAAAPALPAGDAPAPGALRVRLAFDAAADLDLYVTGPMLETVYFANTPSRVGGALERDVRCGDPEPRVETITFEDAPSGRYRVGVDFPERCHLPARPVAFSIRVEGDGLQREHRGEIELGVFAPVVLEFELPAGR